MQFPKTYRTNLGWALSAGAIIALIAGKGVLVRSAIVGLVIIGAIGATWAAWEHHWLPRRYKSIGVLFAIWGGMGFFGWWVWPQENDTAKKIEQILLGQEYNPEKLASQFPIGYVVFELKNDDKLEFYKGLSLIRDYDFDWSKVKYTKNENDTFEVLMPDIVENSPTQKLRFSGNRLGGPKRVGWWNTYYTSGQFIAIAEVLDTNSDGIVFLVGLMPPKN